MILLTTVAVAALILIVSRSLRVLFGTVARLVGPAPAPAPGVGAGRHRAAAAVLGAADRCAGARASSPGRTSMFSVRDTDTPATGVAAAWSRSAPAAPASLAAWDTLGRQGRIFTGWGPRAEQINTFSGGGAKEPIRAYVGLKSAETLQERADLLLEELQADRRVRPRGPGRGHHHGHRVPRPARGRPGGVHVQRRHRDRRGAVLLPAQLAVAAGRQAGGQGDLPGRVRHGPRVLGDPARGVPAQALPVRPVAGLLRRGQRPELDQHRQRADRRGAHVRPAVRQRAAQGDRRRTAIPAPRRGSRSTARAAPCASPPSRTASPRPRARGARPGWSTCSTTPTRWCSSPRSWPSRRRTGWSPASAARTSPRRWAGSRS